MRPPINWRVKFSTCGVIEIDGDSDSTDREIEWLNKDTHGSFRIRRQKTAMQPTQAIPSPRRRRDRKFYLIFIQPPEFDGRPLLRPNAFPTIIPE